MNNSNDMALIKEYVAATSPDIQKRLIDLKSMFFDSI